MHEATGNLGVRDFHDASRRGAVAARVKHPGPCRPVSAAPGRCGQQMRYCMTTYVAEVLMRPSRSTFVALTLALLAIAATGERPRADSVALTGQATSAEEGAMEG